MNAATAARELAATILDTLREGDLRGHIAAWWETIHTPTWEQLAPISYTLTPEHDTKHSMEEKAAEIFGPPPPPARRRWQTPILIVRKAHASPRRNTH